jgi:hypothetical protein
MGGLLQDISGSTKKCPWKLGSFTICMHTASRKNSLTSYKCLAEFFKPIESTEGREWGATTILYLKGAEKVLIIVGTLSLFYWMRILV